MRQYLDATGKVHKIEITLQTRRDVRDVLGIDLVMLSRDPASLESLLHRVSDVDKLIEFCGVLEGSTVEQLEAEWNADTAEAAGIAVVEAIADFFPQSSPLKKPLQSLMDKAKAGQAIAADAIEQKLMRAVDELDLLTVVSQQTIPTNGFAESPQSPGFGTAAGDSTG